MTQLNLKGIVHNSSSQINSNGNCEEIINLRLCNDSLQVVGKKQTIIKGRNFEKIYIHKYGSIENFIELKNGKIIWFASRNNNIIENKEQEICRTLDNVEFNQLNNILLIKGEGFITKATFEDKMYDVVIFELPDVPDLGIILNERTNIQLPDDFTPSTSTRINTKKWKPPGK